MMHIVEQELGRRKEEASDTTSGNRQRIDSGMLLGIASALEWVTCRIGNLMLGGQVIAQCRQSVPHPCEGVQTWTALCASSRLMSRRPLSSVSRNF